MTSKVESIHTCCKNCVFAKYENITQIGCHLDYIQKYKDLGAEILEAYDQEKEFYLINNKKCIGYRENKWFNDNSLCLEDKIAIYNEKNKLSYTMVINLAPLSVDDLNHILAQINNDLPPQKIIIIRHRDNDLKFSYDKIKSMLDEHQIKCTWRIQTMVDDTIPYDAILHHISMHNYNSRFIMSVTNPTDRITDIVVKADTIVHRELGNFVIIANEAKSAIIYCGSVYRYAFLVNEEKVLDKEDNYLFI